LSAYLEITKELLSKNQDLPTHVSLAFELEIVESFREIYHTFYNETLLRRIVKDLAEFEAYGLGEFNPLAKQLLGAGFVRLLEAKINQIDEKRSDFYTLSVKDSKSYSIVKRGERLDKYLYIEGHFSDRLQSVLGSVTSGLSAGFGALVGNIEFRSGYLYQLESFKKHMLSKLRPLDLLFEKKTFKLTDKTIPGNWGHVALWLGTKEELIELGIWDEPELTPFRERIEAGHSIFEMRRWGMQFDSLENFLNLDEIAITRVRNILELSKYDLLQIYATLAQQ